MRNRPHPRLFVFALILAAWLHPVESGAQTSAPQEWVTPSEVLVLFNASWPDEDRNGRSDSQDVAEYYAARRGIPKEDLLGVAVTGRQSKADYLTYPDFFRRVLVPTRKRLVELAARGTHIHYVVTCYGMPLVVDTRFGGKQREHPIWKPTDYDAGNRALTGWLVNREENFEVGFDPVTGKPGKRGGKSAAPGSSALGTVLGDIALPWIRGAFDRPDETTSFKRLRAASPARRDLSGHPSRR
jgi:hypothetical protein